MDVFPPLSSHFSFVWCVLHLICPFFFPPNPLLIVGLSLTQCSVTRSEPISHAMWSSECFIQSLTSWISKQLLLLFACGRINRKTLGLWCKRSTEIQAASLSVKKETSFYTKLCAGTFNWIICRLIFYLVFVGLCFYGKPSTSGRAGFHCVHNLYDPICSHIIGHSITNNDNEGGEYWHEETRCPADDVSIN